MLKIEKDHKKLVSLRQLILTPASTTERYDLREFILNSPDEFFSEVGQKLFVIGRDIHLSEAAHIQVDLLALDQTGQTVVVVMERDEEKSPLLRAITSAGLVAKWEAEDFLRLLSDEQTASIRAFLAGDVGQINRQQRIIFVAETFDFEALTATAWLNNRGIDFYCVRLTRADGFQTDAEYLWCSHVSTPEGARQPLVMREGDLGLSVSVGEAPAQTLALDEQLASEIVARKQVEEALRASEERYWTLAKLSPVGIFHTDAEGNLLYVNERWCEMAGLSQEEALGQGWARGLHSDDRDRVLTDWHDTVEQGLPFKAEFRFQRPDGGTSWVLGEAAVQKDEPDRVTGYVGTVTELHRVDASRGGTLAGQR